MMMMIMNKWTGFHSSAVVIRSDQYVHPSFKLAESNRHHGETLKKGASQSNDCVVRLGPRAHRAAPGMQPSALDEEYRLNSRRRQLGIRHIHFRSLFFLSLSLVCAALVPPY